MSDITSDLNSAQAAAVGLPTDAHAIVLAGAGSGKTRVLVNRVAWLCQANISPHAIFVVTFTNKAAGEMHERLMGLLGQPTRQFWIGTFHGLAHRMIRQHSDVLGLSRNFQILDAEDQLRAIKNILRRLNLDPTVWPPKTVRGWINDRKDDALRAQQVQTGGDAFQRRYCDIYAAYEQYCRDNDLVDFAELLLLALELVRDHAQIREQYQLRFSHLLVDEFQDTSTIQYLWLRQLAGERGRFFVVGDDDQAIYRWRGARVENMLNFSSQLPNVQLIRLEQNYRSTGSILDAANAMIANNGGRIGKRLWTASGPGEAIVCYSAYNEQDEAQFVIQQIQLWVADNGCYRDCAILYRSSAQSRVIESALIQAGLSYLVYGGQRFFERAEIKDALAYLRLIENRDDDIALMRIINQPPRGLGAKTLQLFGQLAQQQQMSLWQAIAQALETGAIGGRAASASAAFVALIESFDDDRHKLPLPELIARVIRGSGLRDYLLQEPGEKAKMRVENLDELVSVAPRADEVTRDEAISELTQFLSEVTLNADGMEDQRPEDCVQMMTLHASKGLEFPVVFIVGMEEGLLPSYQSLNLADALQEERRLCYVGITRARKRAYLSHAHRRMLYGRTQQNLPSRFVREIPSLQDMSPVPLVEPVRDLPPSDLSPDLPQAEGGAFTLGQRVRHHRFGEGTVTNLEGRNEHARVQVRFAGAGSKWLVLTYANLEAC